MTSMDENVGYDARKGVVAVGFLEIDAVALISLMERQHLTLTVKFRSRPLIVTCKLRSQYFSSTEDTKHRSILTRTRSRWIESILLQQPEWTATKHKVTNQVRSKKIKKNQRQKKMYLTLSSSRSNFGSGASSVGNSFKRVKLGNVPWTTVAR